MFSFFGKELFFLNYEHKSVLLDECIQNLDICAEGIYVDGTLGGAGHSLQICKKLSSNSKLLCIDRDINALSKAREVLHEYLHKVIFVHDNFCNISKILQDLKIDKIQSMILDLGVSSHQLDEAFRGFSYMKDSKIDMRMDTTQNITAYDVLNNYSQDKLADIIFKYGEEKWAKKISQYIVEYRKHKNIYTTFELVEIIKRAVPAKFRREGPHPAKRTFQAIRIEVNNELGILEDTIFQIIEKMEYNSKLCIISFHSLEDRIIKETFRFLQKKCICPKELPICVCSKEKEIEILTKKPILPSENEILENPRSRSAKLRVCKKI